MGSCCAYLRAALNLLGKALSPPWNKKLFERKLAPLLPGGSKASLTQPAAHAGFRLHKIYLENRRPGRRECVTQACSCAPQACCPDVLCLGGGYLGQSLQVQGEIEPIVKILGNKLTYMKSVGNGKAVLLKLVRLPGQAEALFIQLVCVRVVLLARFYPRQHEERLGHPSLVRELPEEGQGLLR